MDIYGLTRSEMGEVSFILFLYQGLYLDGETGLDDNCFRYYSPETGAYISAHQSCRHPEQDSGTELPNSGDIEIRRSPHSISIQDML